MAHDYAQRRRVALALAITVIAAPAAFLLNRSSGDDDADRRRRSKPWSARSLPPAAASSPARPVDRVGRRDRRARHLACRLPVGHTVPVDVVAGPDRRAPPARVGEGDWPRSAATIDSTLRCHANAAEVPFNATITVTNLDNSRSVQCVSSIGGAQPETTIVLATATFAQIADLTDAPVPVQITWASN